MYNPYMVQDLEQMRNRIDSQLRSMQQMQNQVPVQNIINTTNQKVDLEARYLNENENIRDVLVSNRTVFIDEKNKVISIKELDGSISKSYQIIVPKDEKEILLEKIEALEKSNEEMRMMLNEYTNAKFNKPINDVEQSDTVDFGDPKSSTKKSSK